MDARLDTRIYQGVAIESLWWEGIAVLKEGVLLRVSGSWERGKIISIGLNVGFKLNR